MKAGYVDPRSDPGLHKGVWLLVEHRPAASSCGCYYKYTSRQGLRLASPILSTLYDGRWMNFCITVDVKVFESSRMPSPKIRSFTHPTHELPLFRLYILNALAAPFCCPPRCSPMIDFNIHELYQPPQQRMAAADPSPLPISTMSSISSDPSKSSLNECVPATSH